MIYRDNKFIHIELDKSNKIALVKSKAFINDKEYKKSWLSLTDLMFEFRIRKILVNDQETKVIALKSTEWLVENILPKLLANLGNIKAAIIPPEDIFYQVSIKNLQSQIDNYPNLSDKTNIKWFEQPDEGLNWLKEG